MNIGRIGALVRHDARLLRREPTFIIAMTAMPLLVISFLRDTVGAAIGGPGASASTGASQAVPGMAVMFAAFLVSNVAFNVFREHGWSTWPRLRCSGATMPEILIGLVLGPAACIALQQVVVYTAGVVLFDLRIEGPVLALVAVVACFVGALVGCGLLLLSVCRTLVQVDTAVNLGALALAGLGGAFAPFETLPTWAQHLAPAVPTYWAMRAIRHVVDGTATAGGVILSCSVLLATALLTGVLAVRLFDASRPKIRIG